MLREPGESVENFQCMHGFSSEEFKIHPFGLR